MREEVERAEYEPDLTEQMKRLMEDVVRRAHDELEKNNEVT